MRILQTMSWFLEGLAQSLLEVSGGASDSIDYYLQDTRTKMSIPLATNSAVTITRTNSDWISYAECRCLRTRSISIGYKGGWGRHALLLRSWQGPFLWALLWVHVNGVYQGRSSVSDPVVPTCRTLVEWELNWWNYTVTSPGDVSWSAVPSLKECRAEDRPQINLSFGRIRTSFVKTLQHDWAVQRACLIYSLQVNNMHI